MYLYGKRPVLERLKTAPDTIRKLFIQQNAQAAEVVQAAKIAGIRFESINKATANRMLGDVHTQGIFAETTPFAYADFGALLTAEDKPLLFFLDRITDPQNLGAMLRTFACMGHCAIVLPKHDSVEVTETVLRVASGGENYVPVAQVTNLVAACEQAKKQDFWIAGASADGGESTTQTKWPFPLGVVLGSEGTGIRPGLAKHLDFTFTLPMPGAELSFNVATSAALIAYEILEHGGFPKT